MKFNYVKIENMPVSIETDLKKLGYMRDALGYFKDSNDVNNPICQYDARKLYDEVNAIIVNINSHFKN
jgi:hypothetical protein|tara:strand:- start:477 stop:680 length:204 start_codon:yes stop_codon:yes gene_type:complete